MQGVFPSRDISEPHGVAFIKFTDAVVSWLLPRGWAVGVSLLQILLFTSDWTYLRIIWPLTHYGLRVIFVVTEAGRKIFLSRAIYSWPFAVVFPETISSFTIFSFSCFLSLACQSRASDRTKQSEQDFQECRFLTVLL